MTLDGRKVAAAGALLVVLGLLAAAPWGMAADASTRLLARNTLLLAVGTCVLSLPSGALLALLLARTDAPGRRFVALVLGALLFVPLYVQAAAWDAGFFHLGWHTATRGALQTPLLTGWQAAVCVHAAASIPWVVLIIAIGLRFVDPQLEEQALLDGSTA